MNAARWADDIWSTLVTEEHAVIGPDGPRIAPFTRELSVGALRPFGRKHIHKVSNLDLEPAVSLHVYAPALVEMNAFTPVGDLLSLTESQLVGLNW